MRKIIKHVGMDVHKDSISISVADEGRDKEVRYYGTIRNDTDQLYKVMRTLTSTNAELRCVYEAGPCGYNIYRFLTNKNINCEVIAPSLIPQKSGNRIKTDRRDSVALARLHRSGELTSVYVPNPEDEALRDLVRAREDFQRALRAAKQQLGAFLLRHDYYFSGKSKWSKAYFTWLAEIAMPHHAQQITLQEYIDTVGICKERVSLLTEQIRQLSGQSRQKAMIGALQSMRGVSLIVSSTLVAEIGDLKRFDTPGKLMAFLGLIPSEHSTGEKKKRGAITKTGNRHARKALVEAAQAYRLPARKSRAILKRQSGVNATINEIAWKAQVRLCGRYRKLAGKGKNSNLVKTAVARELAGFVWAIGQEPSLSA